MSWVFLSVAALTLLAAVGYGVYVFARPQVVVTEVVEGPVVQAFYSTGTVSPEHEFPIRSNIAGVVEEMLVDKGDAVKKGQKLAVVVDPELILVYRRAEAELREKRALASPDDSPVLREFDAKIAAMEDLLEIAKREHDRLSEMVRSNAASQVDFDRTLERLRQYWSDLESLKAAKAQRLLSLKKDVEVAEATLEIAQANLEQQTLTSPVDGVVLDRPVTLGTRLAVNDHVMEIADVSPSNLVMRAQVDEEDKTRVRMGQVVQMTLYSFPGEVFQGQVTRIYDRADPQRRTFEIDVRLDQLNDRLSPGMTGELAFIVAEKSSASVAPAQALQGGAVYAVRDGRIVKLDAEIGLRSIERIEIVRGARAGERVLVSPIGGLSEGQKVRTRFIDPVEAAGMNKPAETEGSFRGFN